MAGTGIFNVEALRRLPTLLEGPLGNCKLHWPGERIWLGPRRPRCQGCRWHVTVEHQVVSVSTVVDNWKTVYEECHHE